MAFENADVTVSSGNVAAASAVATLPAPTTGSWIVTGIEVTFAGATGAANAIGTITGLSGGTVSFIVTAPAGATVAGTPIKWDWPNGLRGIPKTAVVLTLPTLGAGNTHACATIHGVMSP